MIVIFCICHTWLPAKYVYETAIVPIIMHKTEDTSDKNNSFDKINHYTLFQKLLDRKTPIMLVRILLFWYTKQRMCVKWGNCMSDYFYVSNGIRQGGTLSPKLYSVYVDDLYDHLVKSQIGCHIDNECVTYVMYADDIIFLNGTEPCSFTEANKYVL